MDKIIVVVLAFVGILALALLFVFPIMWLWNWVITPEVTLVLFGIPKLTFWKTLGVSLLCSFLFGSYRKK